MTKRTKPVVLVLDEWIPYPANTGKKIRSYNLLRKAAESFSVIYVAFADEQTQRGAIARLNEDGITVLPVQDDRPPKGGVRYWLAVAINLLQSDPFASVYHYSRSYEQALRTALATYCPDLVHIEWTFYARYLHLCTGIPGVVSSHNAEHQQWERMAKAVRNPLTRLYCRVQATKVRRFEAHHYPRASVCTVVSGNDRRIIQRYGARTILVENGVDTRYFSPLAAQSAPGDSRLVFTASMDAFSNQDAAMYFMTAILPRIRSRRTEVEFVVVGKSPPRRLVATGQRTGNVRFTGTVDDVRPFIHSAAVCVVPLRVGGGTRLKILEAMAMGKAVVTTGIGCDGLEVVPGKHLIVADTPSEFASCVLSLMADPQARATLGRTAREYVTGRYDWQPIAERFVGVWKREIDTPAERSCFLDTAHVGMEGGGLIPLAERFHE
jgi:sugar transferase (PEP-CTERM/EpsH1 system associated)